MFAILGVAALLLGSLATGALSATLGGPPSAAALFALMPGAYLSLRFTLADSLALALAVAALAASARERPRLAVVLAVLAVLARETTLVVFAGWWLGARRDRGRAEMVLVAAATAGSLAILLRVAVPAGAAPSGELGLPLLGLIDATRLIWTHGQELLGLVITVASIGLGVWVLVRRGLRHPLSWVIAANLAFVTVMGTSVVGLYFGAGRTMMPILLFGSLMLVCPGPAASPSSDGHVSWRPPRPRSRLATVRWGTSA